VLHTFSPEFPIIEGFVSLKMKVTVGTNTSNKRGKSRSFWCISIVSLNSVANAFFALMSATWKVFSETSQKVDESKESKANQFHSL